MRIEGEPRRADRLGPRRDAPVDLSHHHRAVAAVENYPWLDVVRAKIYERTHRSLGARHRCDSELVEAVLRRDHAAGGAQMRKQRTHGALRVMRLRREHDSVPLAAQRVGSEGRYAYDEIRDRPGDVQPGVIDRIDVLLHVVDERDVVARACEMRAHGSTDRARTPDEKSHRRSAR